MKDLLRHFTRDNIIGGAVCIVLGVLFILLPGSFSNILVYVSGILLIIGGVVSLISFVMDRSAISKYGLANAAVLIILGIFTLTHIYMIKGVLNMFFGVIIVSFGSIFLSRSIDNLRNHISGTILPLVMSLLIVAAGVVVLFGKFSTIFTFTGIVLVVAGIFIIIMAALFGSQTKKASRKASPMDAEWKEV